MSAKSQLEAAIDRLKLSSGQVNAPEISQKYAIQMDQLLLPHI